MTDRVEFVSNLRVEGLIRSTVGKIFTAKFIKKDGSTRRMNARIGVKKGVKGTGSPNGLNTTAVKVYDVQARGFRQINIATVKWVKIGGVKYLVTG